MIRVCADPDNMPLSNQKGEGFEQKIAELVAKEWNAKIEYAWWPVRRGFFARALNGRYCDVAIQAPAEFDMAGVTKPYFRSGYVFVTRKDSGLDIKSLADPRLKKLKIGVNILNSDAENTPPAMALSRYGVVGNLTGYPTFYTDSIRPEDIVTAVAKKDIDVAIVWGPIAGYFAKQVAGSVDAAAPGRARLADRFPLSLQHRNGRAAARPGAARQPADGAGPQGSRRSRPFSRSTGFRSSRFPRMPPPDGRGSQGRSSGASRLRDGQALARHWPQPLHIPRTKGSRCEHAYAHLDNRPPDVARSHPRVLV